MPSGSLEDRKMLSDLPKETLMELFFNHIRSVWGVDGLYFIGIERKFGTQSATEIDKSVWEEMARIEARRLKKCLSIAGDDIPSMMKALRASSWALDLEEKEVTVSQDGQSAFFRNINCRTQNTRIRKGMSEFPCKPVRFGYLKAFAQEFNPRIEVTCRVCPPDKRQVNVWCEWEFKMKG